MKKRYRYVRKSYAMRRMARAIERAMQAGSSKESERAIRWVAAWGLLCGIKTPGVRLRDSDVDLLSDARVRQPSDQIDVPSNSAFTLTEEMIAKHEVAHEFDQATPMTAYSDEGNAQADAG